MDVKEVAIVLRGGPFDGTRLNDESGGDVALVELETDGLVHRYVPTSHT